MSYRSSLEVLQQGTFSTASDVWSYGITLWEIYSLGAVPWDGLSSTEVHACFDIYSLTCTVYLNQITDAYLGKRYLEKPKRCHQHIYHMMLNCWNVYPEQRISFNDICHTLNEVSSKQAFHHSVTFLSIHVSPKINSYNECFSEAMYLL